MEVGAVDLFEAALAGYAAVGGLDVCAALVGEFLRENGFEAARAGGEEGVIGHGTGFLWRRVAKTLSR